MAATHPCIWLSSRFFSQPKKFGQAHMGSPSIHSLNFPNYIGRPFVAAAHGEEPSLAQTTVYPVSSSWAKAVVVHCLVSGLQCCKQNL
jgi:hypothetical protein